MKKQISLFVLLGIYLISYAQNKPVFNLSDNYPAFYDELWGASCDPVMVWNEKEGEWFIYYTQRRGNLEMEVETIEWMHGTSIGIASSRDGKVWRYRGICQGNDNLSNDMAALSSWWAPDIVYVEGLFHMYVTSVPGVFKDWNMPRYIKHFTSKNGLDWNYISTIPLSSDKCIDPGICKIGSKWYMWYKDERYGNSWFAESPDLYSWKVVGPAITDCEHEAPFVWKYDNKYWIIIDAWTKASRIYSSDDGLGNWKYACTINAAHPAVYIIDKKIYLIRHVYDFKQKTNNRGAAIDISELSYKNGVYMIIDK